jgi:large subunit ribosomal protein L24
MLKVKKGDNVQILLGKDNGKTGSVEKIFSKSGKVLVQGVNQYKRHVRSMQGVEGGVITLSKPVDMSNVALVCPSCKKPTRVGFKVEGGDKTRICKKCGKDIK